MRLLKKAATKENANIKKNLCPIHKIIKVFQLLVQWEGETYCCLKSSRSHDWDNCNICVNLY